MTKKRVTYNLKMILITMILIEFLMYILFSYSSLIITGFSSRINEMSFVKEENLSLYWYSPLIAVLFLFNIWRYNKKLAQFDLKVLENIMSPVSNSLILVKYILLRISVLFLIVAMAQPAFGKKKTSGTREALELVVCIDISNSMNTKDIAEDLSRLDVTKRALNQLVNQLHGERIGICIFANSAFVQLPVTRDYGAAKLFIGDIETNMISNQGTNIQAALETASKMFSPERTGKATLLITDGENHEANPDKIFSELKKQKVNVLIMGIGTTKGGLVPKDPRRPELGYKKSAMGTPVHSKLNRDFINKLASKAGSEPMFADQEFPDLSPLLTQINHMKRVKIDNLEFEIKEEKYQIPLAITLALWLVFLFVQFNYKRS